MGETAMHWAVQMSKADVVDVLIRFNADVTIENNQGETPLELDAPADLKARLQRTFA